MGRLRAPPGDYFFFFFFLRSLTGVAVINIPRIFSGVKLMRRATNNYFYFGMQRVE